MASSASTPSVASMQARFEELTNHFNQALRGLSEDLLERNQKFEKTIHERLERRNRPMHSTQRIDSSNEFEEEESLGGMGKEGDIRGGIGNTIWKKDTI